MRPMAWKGMVAQGVVLSLLQTAFPPDKNILHTNPLDAFSSRTRNNLSVTNGREMEYPNISLLLQKPKVQVKSLFETLIHFYGKKKKSQLRVKKKNTLNSVRTFHSS